MRVTLSGNNIYYFYYFVNGDLAGSGSFTRPTADKFYIKSGGGIYLDELRVTTGAQPQLYADGNWADVTAMVYDGSRTKSTLGFQFSPVSSAPDVEAIYFYKYHRHYQTSVDVFSQSYEDMDVTLRRLAQNFYVVRRSLVPFCVVARRIRRKVGVDEQTKQIQDLYAMGMPLLDTKRIFSPPLWKLFNSYSRRELPELVRWRNICLSM